MGVKVNETGHHEAVCGVDRPHGTGDRDVGLDCLDQAVANADVALGTKRPRGIENLAALDDEVELVVRAHSSTRSARHRGKSCGGDPGRAKQQAATT